MAFLAVFVALKIAHRAGGYAVWSWIPTTCDLRRPEYRLLEVKKSVNPPDRGTTFSCFQKNDVPFRHDAGVFSPS